MAEAEASPSEPSAEPSLEENRPQLRSPGLKRVPPEEFASALDAIFAGPDAYDPLKIAAAYQALGLEVIADPASPRLIDLAVAALRARTGHSAIRVSDGEMNIIAYGGSDERPALDRWAATVSVSKQSDGVKVTDGWLRTFRQVLLGSVARSDVVGVPGLWAEEGPTRQFWHKPERFRDDFQLAPRGLYGDWQGRSYLLALAKTGLFRGGVVASNHFYFAYLNHLDQLVDAASSILLMTSRAGIRDKLQSRYGKPVSLIVVGKGDPRRETERTPFFLQGYENQLPRDLSGTLCLIGGGPWALIYCQWAKERGGVGIDMGSGMNLLDGEIRRATHRRALRTGTYLNEAGRQREEEGREARRAARQAARETAAKAEA